MPTAPFVGAGGVAPRATGGGELSPEALAKGGSSPEAPAKGKTRVTSTKSRFWTNTELFHHPAK